MVLGLLVFITVLVFGIYFAEVGALTLKVQEAANFALWEATGHVQHDPEAGTFQHRGIAALTEQEAQWRYRDFDGRGGGAGSPVQQAFARARPIQVTCEQDLPWRGPDDPVGVRPQDAAAALEQSMNIRSLGMSCTASAAMRAEGIGRFLEPSFFNTSQQRATRLFTVCAAGRARGGECRGRFSLLLDDWGLAGAAEGRSCPLNINGARRCQNPDYYEWAQRVYRNNGAAGNAGSALAGAVGAVAGINEDQFFMSFRGEENDYEEDIGASHAGNQRRWETTPFLVPPGGPRYDVPRRNNWLGGVSH